MADQKKGFDVPEGYKSKDVEDRRTGDYNPSLLDKGKGIWRDAWIATRRDWDAKNEIEARKRGEQVSTEFKQLGDKKYPSYKKGGVVRKTGLIYAHKGETIFPKGSVKFKASRKKGRARK